MRVAFGSTEKGKWTTTVHHSGKQVTCPRPELAQKQDNEGWGEVITYVWVMTAENHPPHSGESQGFMASTLAQQDLMLIAGERKLHLSFCCSHLHGVSHWPAVFLKGLTEQSSIRGGIDYAHSELKSATWTHITLLLWRHIKPLSLLLDAAYLLSDSTHSNTWVKIACSFLT